ncbi:uncharacterized protein LOC132270504 [Cornus florida]|uniref:uncharacterized protein LOC132270504 n=1 Tax=Cornus florida TaxID=4283 RepID=UPI00289850B1|nr:uncharacterized protein LOC132270504 [Cornus florida]
MARVKTVARGYYRRRGWPSLDDKAGPSHAQEPTPPQSPVDSCLQSSDGASPSHDTEARRLFDSSVSILYRALAIYSSAYLEHHDEAPREQIESGACSFKKKDWDKSYNALIKSLRDDAVEAAEDLEAEEQAAAAANPATDDIPVDPAAVHIDINLEQPAEDAKEHSPVRSPIHDAEQAQDHHSPDPTTLEAPAQTPVYFLDPCSKLTICNIKSWIYCRYKPDVIKGDMDSIRQEVKDFYENKLCILVLGALGGRFDHEAGNINVLYRFSAMRILLLSNHCLIQLLPKTHNHEIHIQSSVEGLHCGLVPIGMPSRSTTTSGLEWNLVINWRPTQIVSKKTGCTETLKLSA